ncbi:ATP/GTP-binding protein (plasmid) [Kitasatospora sp. NBC_00374]|uniref:ATP/GTP-binding protein n=1 Tax=Kitasatospora sp. NBC_00374 TaxID=2975964 RepID=UPI002F906768
MSTTADSSMPQTLVDIAVTAWSWSTAAGGWLADNGDLVLMAVVPPAIAAFVVRYRILMKTLADRQRFILTPTRRFDPTPEDIWRQTAVVLRAAGKGPWWAPRAAKRVRVRLRADGSTPLEYSLEAHVDAATLLRDSRYREVSVAKAAAADDAYAAQVLRERAEKKAEKKESRKAAKKTKQTEGATGKEKKPERLHVVRAEFVLRGRPSAGLREVPLEPDPLQPFIDAVTDIRTELGEVAEVVLDLQSVPGWQVKLRQWQLLHEDRERERTRARKAAGHAATDAADVQESWRFQLATLFEPSSPRRAPMVPTPRTQPLSPDKALGRLANSRGLVRIQVLVRCTSTMEGRARQLLGQLTAAMDVFGEGSRLSPDAGRFLWMTWSADSRHRREAFDRRWTTGQVAPRKQNWVNVSELQGLLKPPTAHSVLPVLASELADYVPGEALVPQGYLTYSDGRRRLIATQASEFLFAVKVGKSFYGKTEFALVQAIALALAGEGVLFVDPHGDTWKSVAPYLAHPALASLVCRIDLARAEDPGAVIPGWNMIGMDRGQNPARTVTAAVDALATALGWSDSTHPRAATILTKAIEALVTYNLMAVNASRADAQATLLQVRALLTDKAVQRPILDLLSADQRRWWETTFATYPPDVLAPVTNPLDRLSANPVTRAFLGNPTGAYDIRKAMDEGKIVWLCLEGTGPSDRLLISMIMQDLLRDGLSRRDTPEDARRPFHVFADELISLDPAGGPTFASITEQLRKFKVRLHVMVQHLNRVQPTTRESLLQNASVVSTTAGAMAAIRVVTDEWHGAVDPAAVAELSRFQHYVQVTANGAPVGPLRVEGPQVKEVFKAYYSPNLVGRMTASANRAVRAEPTEERLRRAREQDAVVLAFLSPEDGGEASPLGGQGVPQQPGGGPAVDLVKAEPARQRPGRGRPAAAAKPVNRTE